MKKEDYIQLEKKIDLLVTEKNANLRQLKVELNTVFNKIREEEGSKRK